MRSVCQEPSEVNNSGERAAVRLDKNLDSLSIDMLLSAVSVLVVAQSIFEIPEGLLNNPVYVYKHM